MAGRDPARGEYDCPVSELARELLHKLQGLWQQRRPRKPAHLLTRDPLLLFGRLRRRQDLGWALHSGISHDDSRDSRAEDGRRDVQDVARAVAVRGDFDHDFRFPATLRLACGLDDCSEEPLETLALLQRPQTGRVGRGHVDHQDVREPAELLHALDVVPLDSLDVCFRGVFVLADLHGEQPALPQRRGDVFAIEDLLLAHAVLVGVATHAVAQADGSDVGANGVETVAVDEAVRRRQAEHAGLRITHLRARSDAADFEDGDRGGEREQRVDALGVFVEPSRDGERRVQVVAKQL